MKKDKKIRDLVHEMRSELRGVYPEREINSLIPLVMNRFTHLKKPHHLHLHQDDMASASQVSHIKDIIKQLKSGKPIQQILGETEFYDLTIKIKPSVLIPRQETEELVDWIIADFQDKPVRILDIGTGSGCIALALAQNMEKAEVHALDVSREALELAKENARINKTPIHIFQADILNDDQPSSQYGLIVSNPPYVRESEKKFMHKNILEHEPHQALFVDDKIPLFFYRKILKFAQSHLAPKGWVYFEINEAMGQEMARLIEKEGYHNIRLKNDLNGKNRMIKAQKP